MYECFLKNNTSWSVSLSVVCLSVCLWLFLCQLIHASLCLPIYLSVCLCLFLCQLIHAFFCLAICLSVCLPAWLFLWQPICLSPYLPAYLSVSCWLGSSLSLRCLLLSWSVLVQINQFLMLFCHITTNTRPRVQCIIMCSDTSWWPPDIIAISFRCWLEKGRQVICAEILVWLVVNRARRNCNSGRCPRRFTGVYPGKVARGTVQPNKKTNKQTFMQAQEEA